MSQMPPEIIWRMKPEDPALVAKVEACFTAYWAVNWQTFIPYSPHLCCTRCCPGCGVLREARDEGFDLNLYIDWGAVDREQMSNVDTQLRLLELRPSHVYHVRYDLVWDWDYFASAVWEEHETMFDCAVARQDPALAWIALEEVA